MDSEIERGIAAGWIEPPRRNGLVPATRHCSNESTTAVLDQDRATTE